MGVIQSLLQSTTERVSIPEVRKAGYAQAMKGLGSLRPDLERDASIVLDRAWACRTPEPERPSSVYRFTFRVPPGLDQPLAFLSVHRGDLEPVHVRVPGHNAEIGNLFVLFQPLPDAAAEQTAEFTVPHVTLSLPAGRQQLLAVFGVVSCDGRLRVAERLPLLADIVVDQFSALDPCELEGPAGCTGGAAMLEAVVGLSLFVAFADGHYDRKEEQAILDALLDLDDPPRERRSSFRADLARAAGAFRYKKEILDEHCQQARLGLTDEARSQLIAVLFRVATIDGILHANEEKLLHYVAAQIGVPQGDVQARIDDFFALNR